MSNCEHNCKCINKQKEIGELMNYIGDKLKNLRQQLGLTQTEMAAGVISVSFYSKVERGLNDIGINDFLEILKKHGISPMEFFEDITIKENDKRKITGLYNKFIKVATEDNDVEINKVIKDLDKIKTQNPDIKFTKIAAKLIADTHDRKALKKLTTKQKNQIKKMIFQKDPDENEYYRIVILANIIRIYSIDEANFLVKNVIRRYSGSKKRENKTEIALSVLMVNYANWCIELGKFDYCYEPLDFLKKLPEKIDLAFTKILGLYFGDLVRQKNDEANEIRVILNKAGFGTFVNKLVK